MADSAKIVVTAAEMDQMSPQQRADAVAAAAAHSWEEVAEPFRSEVLAAARTLGEQRHNANGASGSFRLQPLSTSTPNSELIPVVTRNRLVSSSIIANPSRSAAGSRWIGKTQAHEGRRAEVIELHQAATRARGSGFTTALPSTSRRVAARRRAPHVLAAADVLAQPVVSAYENGRREPGLAMSNTTSRPSSRSAANR